MQKKERTIICDLSILPLTFDVAVYFCIVFAYSISKGFTNFNLIIRADKPRKITNREINTPTHHKYWRLWNIIIPLTKILPGVQSVQIVYDETLIIDKNVDVYPPGYAKRELEVLYTIRNIVHLANQKRDVQILRSNRYAEEVVENYIKNKAKVIVIPLRKAAFDSSRDADYELWYEVYKRLKSLGYYPVIIPDQADVFGDRLFQSYDWVVCEFAAIDLELRLAFYKKYVSVAWGGGHCVPLWLSKSRFIMFGNLNEDSSVANSEWFAVKNNMPVGLRPNFLIDGQEWDWREAKYIDSEYIIAETTKYLSKINY